MVATSPISQLGRVGQREDAAPLCLGQERQSASDLSRGCGVGKEEGDEVARKMLRVSSSRWPECRGRRAVKDASGG